MIFIRLVTDTGSRGRFVNIDHIITVGDHPIPDKMITRITLTGGDAVVSYEPLATFTERLQMLGDEHDCEIGFDE